MIVAWNEEDEAPIRGKITVSSLAGPQAELRFDAEEAQVLILVSLNGKILKPGSGKPRLFYPDEEIERWARKADVNVSISMNGTATFNFEELMNVFLAIEEAKHKLELIC